MIKDAPQSQKVRYTTNNSKYNITPKRNLNSRIRFKALHIQVPQYKFTIMPGISKQRRKRRAAGTIHTLKPEDYTKMQELQEQQLREAAERHKLKENGDNSQAKEEKQGVEDEVEKQKLREESTANPTWRNERGERDEGNVK